MGWSQWDSVCSGKQNKLESSPVVLKSSNTRECSGTLTTTEHNVTKWKTAARALALPATQRKIPEEVIVPSKSQLFIIYSSECSTATKFTWLCTCSYKPQSLMEKEGKPWGSFAKLEVRCDGLSGFPKACCTMVRKAYRDFGQTCWTLKKHYRASTIFQNLPDSEVLSVGHSSTPYELMRTFSPEAFESHSESKYSLEVFHSLLSLVTFRNKADSHSIKIWREAKVV